MIMLQSIDMQLYIGAKLATSSLYSLKTGRSVSNWSVFARLFSPLRKLRIKRKSWSIFYLHTFFMFIMVVVA